MTSWAVMNSSLNQAPAGPLVIRPNLRRNLDIIAILLSSQSAHAPVSVLSNGEVCSLAIHAKPGLDPGVQVSPAGFLSTLS